MGSRRFGNYELLEQIGAGGFAEIFLARLAGAEGFAKLLVVKRLLPALTDDRDAVTQFVDEARLAAGFTHPNVVSVFDFGKADDAYYLAMEHVDGATLRKLVIMLQATGRVFPPPAAALVVAEVCRGLHYTHTRTDASGRALRIVHRDVSPQNVMLSWGGDVKVLDFGIATSTARSYRTTTGIVKGKLRYMSPEQAEGGRVDARTDVYACGVLLWELLFGSRPMPDGSDGALTTWVTKAEFIRPKDRAIDPALEAIVMRAIDRQAERRFPSCGDMAEALGRWAARAFPTFQREALARFLHSEFADMIRRNHARMSGAGGSSGPEAAEAAAGVQSVSVSASTSEDAVPDAATGTVSKELPSGLSGVKVDLVARREESRPPEARPRRGALLLAVGAVVLSAAGTLLASRLAGFVRPLAPVPRATAAPLPTVTVEAAPVETTAPATTATRRIVSATPRRTATPVLTAVSRVSLPTPAPTATPVDNVTRAIVPASPVPPPPTGLLSVNVERGWAEVWIDGKRVKGETPLLDHPLPQGWHEVMVVKDGRHTTTRVEVKANDRLRLVLSVE